MIGMIALAPHPSEWRIERAALSAQLKRSYFSPHTTPPDPLGLQLIGSSYVYVSCSHYCLALYLLSMTEFGPPRSATGCYLLFVDGPFGDGWD